MAQFVRALARRAGDPGSNPHPRDNFSLKLKQTNKQQENSLRSAEIF